MGRLSFWDFLHSPGRPRAVRRRRRVECRSEEEEVMLRSGRKSKLSWAMFVVSSEDARGAARLETAKPSRERIGRSIVLRFWPVCI